MRVKLLDCVDIIGGGTPNTNRPDFWNGDIGWLSVDDFKNVNRYVFDSAKTITQAGLNNSSTKLLNANDIIISARGTVGVVALIGKQMAFNQSCFGIRVKNTDVLNPVYLFYLLKINANAILNIDHSSIFDTINMATFEHAEIDLPDRKTQDKIVELLSGIDEQIERNNELVKRLQVLAQTTYSRWFNQFEFPNEHGLPYKSSGGKMVWNDELKIEIPEGWEVDNLYRIADYENGLACQKYRPANDDDKLPVIKITEMHNGYTKETEFCKSGIPDKHIILDGDILFSWSATLEILLWCNGKGVLNQHIFKVIPKNAPKSYVYLQLSNYIQNFVKIAETRKTTMGHITTDHLKQSRIIVPNQNVLKRFDDIVGPIMNQIVLLHQESNKLKTIKERLLPLLINGQLNL